jgi:hypothetical protein
MFFLDSLLIDGLRFVLDKVAAVADAELKDDTVLRERLLEAQMRLDLGELSEAEFARIEREIFDRIRELRGGAHQPISMTSHDASVSVETSVGDDTE